MRAPPLGAASRRSRRRAPNPAPNGAAPRPAASRHHASGRDRLRPAPPRPAEAAAAPRGRRAAPRAMAVRRLLGLLAAAALLGAGRARRDRAARGSAARSERGGGRSRPGGRGRAGPGPEWGPDARLPSAGARWDARKPEPEASRQPAGPRGAGVVPPGSAICAGEPASFFWG